MWGSADTAKSTVEGECWGGVDTERVRVRERQREKGREGGRERERDTERVRVREREREREGREGEPREGEREREGGVSGGRGRGGREGGSMASFRRCSQWGHEEPSPVVGTTRIWLLEPSETAMVIGTITADTYQQSHLLRCLHIKQLG